ncbi:autotransporter domain-containing protein [Bradyrhizobium cenepequi]
MLATVSPVALLLGVMGLTLPAQAQTCTPGNTGACSAPGGSGAMSPEVRGGNGGAGNGDGGNSTVVAGPTVQVPGDPSVNGNGGAGGAGVGVAGGTGGAVGLATSSSASIASVITGGTGSIPTDALNHGAGGGGGGTALYFSGTSLTIDGGGILTGGAGQRGGNGSSGVSDGGGGGGGGAGVTTTAAGITIGNAGAITGGNGGAGGTGAFGGGGGGGGDGLLVLGGNTLINNTGSITGGGGGSGGVGFTISGSAGSSGRGVNLIGGNNRLINSGTITGGAANGGAAGAGVITNGGDTINNSGTISGGLVAGTTHAAAIEFGGTGNTLNLLTGSTLVGDIQLITGAGATIAAQNNGLTLGNAITLGSGSAVTFNTSRAGLSVSGVVSGAGSVTTTGTGTVVLSGTNTYTGGTTISQGTLQLGNGNTSGSITGNVTNDGTLAINRSDIYALGGNISGSGAFVQKGTGTTILTGTNTYTGGTTISNGTLQIGNGGTSGAIAGNIVNNNFLIFDRSNDSAFAGSITGNGLFTKTGAGTLTLSGDNAYTGGTRLLGGTLEVHGGHAIGDSSSVFVLGGSTLRLLDSETVATLSSGATDFGTVDLARGNLTTSLNSPRTTALYYGGLVGAGGLVKDGTYKQVLAGSNSYTGGTTIRAGTLQLGDATHTARIIGSVTNNATFAIVNADTTGLTTITTSGRTTFAGNSTAGNARLVTEAGGVVDLSASTGPTGDRRLAAGSIEGAGLYRLGANAFTVGSNNLSTVVGGTIADGGASGGAGASLTKIGTGTLTLNGQSTYTGATTVNAGKLVVGDDSHTSASLASVATVNSGGTLGGIGTIAGLTAASGGIVAPGNSIGTLNVAGNVNFAAGSIYQVEANAAGQSDRIVATGTATLGGGSVLALAQNGTYAPQTTYTILAANGGVAGSFADVTSSLVFLTPTLGYDANNVFLTFTRSSTAFPDVAATENQRAVSSALQESSLTSPLVIAVLNQSAAGARQAFDALSGEVHASAQTAMLDDSRYVREAVLGRLRQASFTGDAGPMAALASGGPQVAAMESMSVSSALAYAGAQRSAFPMKASPAVPARLPETAFWAQGVGAWGRFDGNGNAASMTRDLAGFFSGVDHRFGANWIAGIAGGYTSSTVRVSDRASSADVATAHLAGYVGATYGALILRGGAAASFSTLDTSRSIVFPNFFDTARARYDATTAQVFGEAGYGLTFGQVALEPFAGLAWVHLDTNSFNETGGSGIAALLGSGTSEDVGYSTLGARIATSFQLTNGMLLTPRASVAWQYALGDVTPTAALAFQSTGANFTVAGVPLARNAALVEGGLDLRVMPQASVGISYVGQLADRVQDHSVKGSFSWKF